MSTTPSNVVNGVSRTLLERLANTLADANLWQHANEISDILNAPGAPNEAHEQALAEQLKLGELRGYVRGLIHANTVCKFKFSGDFESSKRKVGALSCSHEIEGDLLDAKEELREFRQSLRPDQSTSESVEAERDS